MELFVRNLDRIENLLAGNEPLAATVARLVALGERLREAGGLGVVDGPMYESDADAECVYQMLGADEVTRRRRTAAELTGITIRSETLTEDELWSLMNACNVARLALARHLGKFDDAGADLNLVARSVLDEGLSLLSFVVDRAAHTLASS